MKQIDYAYSTAYIRAVENRLLTRADLENLISAKSVHDALRALSDKGFEVDASDYTSFEPALVRWVEAAYEVVKDAAPDGCDLTVLYSKNDFFNLKVAIKAVVAGADADDLYISPYTVEPKKLYSEAVRGSFDNLPKHLCDAGTCAFDVLTRTKDAALCDAMIDKASMDYTQRLANESGSAFLARLVRTENTISDIKIALRGARVGEAVNFYESALSEKSDVPRPALIKAALSGYDAVCEFLQKSGMEEAAKCARESVLQFEKWGRRAVQSVLDDARYVSFGIEPLLCYLYKAESQAAALRLILSGKHNGMSGDEIKNLL